MSYSDPYQQGQNYHNSNSYNNEPTDFDPYNNSQQYKSYEQGPYDAAAGGYRDYPTRPPAGPSYNSSATAVATEGPEKYSRSQSRASLAAPKSTGALRLWRHDEHGNLWTKGGRGACIGRFCCCTIMTVLFFILSIVLAIVLWVRPPDISFGSPSFTQTGSAVVATNDGVTINMMMEVGVKNPNFFTAAFSQIAVDAFYPPNNTRIGGGSLDNVVFKSNTDTTFEFPFAIEYTEKIDPNQWILLDLLRKCGISDPTTKENLKVDYRITLKIMVLMIPIAPSFSGSINVPCPLTKEEIAPFLGDIKIPGINA